MCPEPYLRRNAIAAADKYGTGKHHVTLCPKALCAARTIAAAEEPGIVGYPAKADASYLMPCLPTSAGAAADEPGGLRGAVSGARSGRGSGRGARGAQAALFPQLSAAHPGQRGAGPRAVPPGTLDIRLWLVYVNCRCFNHHGSLFPH